MFAVGGTWEDFDADTLPALHDWYRAVGWQHTSDGCVLRPPYGNVDCSYTFENDLTRLLGELPIRGSFALEIADDEITTVTNRFNSRSADVWQTFHQWVADHHPDDVSRCTYTADTSFALWDVTSIELWEQYVDDFAASDEGYIARAESVYRGPRQAQRRVGDRRYRARRLSRDDGSGLQLTPHDDQDVQAYEEACAAHRGRGARPSCGQ